MSRDERRRLQDIKDAISAIRGHLARERKQPVESDTQAPAEEVGDSAILHDALLFQLVVIGEAVKHLAPETRESASEIPWASVAGLRDLIAHEYFKINMNRVLEIVDRDLPPLERAIDRLLSG